MPESTGLLCVVCSDPAKPDDVHWLHSCGKSHGTDPDALCGCELVAHPDCCPELECQGPNEVIEAAAAKAGWTLGDLNPHAADWVKALRSGDYEQGQGAMRVGEGPDACYCGLGVAAHLAGIEFLRLPHDDGEAPHLFGVVIESDPVPQSSYLPRWLNELLGIYECDNETLNMVNDADGNGEFAYGFAHVANVVELAIRARLDKSCSDPLLRAHEAICRLGSGEAGR